MKNEITLKVKPGQWGELAKIAEDIRTMKKECWQGRKMGSGAVALLLNGYADRIEIALGIQPRPKVFRTPETAIDAVTQNPPMTHEPLYAENSRAAGIGCSPYIIAFLAVCAFLVTIPIAMALLGWLSGGAQQ